MSEDEKVQIDQDLESLIPNFFSNLKNDITVARDAIKSTQSDTLSKIGHKGKGASGSYGFEVLQKLFEELEKCGKSDNFDTANEVLSKIENYMNNVQIEYVEMDY